jgi:hypothetical protein
MSVYGALKISVNRACGVTNRPVQPVIHLRFTQNHQLVSPPCSLFCEYAGRVQGHWNYPYNTDVIRTVEIFYWRGIFVRLRHEQIGSTPEPEWHTAWWVNIARCLDVHSPEPCPSCHSCQVCTRAWPTVPLSAEDSYHFLQAATIKWALNNSKTITTAILAGRSVEKACRERENSRQQVKQSYGEQKAPLWKSCKRIQRWIGNGQQNAGLARLDWSHRGTWRGSVCLFCTNNFLIIVGGKECVLSTAYEMWAHHKCPFGVSWGFICPDFSYDESSEDL